MRHRRRLGFVYYSKVVFSRKQRKDFRDRMTHPRHGDARDRHALHGIARSGPKRRLDTGSVTDRVMALHCPHRPSTFHVGADLRNGRLLFTCFPCRKSWYADHIERLPR